MGAAEAYVFATEGLPIGLGRMARYNAPRDNYVRQM